MKIVIIGGVAGGATAAARLRRLDEKAEIIIFEKSGYISYANCGLPYYIGNVITEKSALTLQTPHSFRRRFNIDVRINHEVTAVNVSDKTVTVCNLTDGKIFDESYDKLIVSTGAKPLATEWSGADNDRIFTLRNIEDTDKIHRFIETERPTSAVIVGGGFVGLEMAENLKALGIDVTIVEYAKQLLTTLDSDMASFIHSKLRSKGIKIIFGAAVTGFRENGQQLETLFGSSSVISDFVISAAGVTPDTSLAQKAGLKLGIKNSIAVNDRMQTSEKDIYAVGDAVEISHMITGGKVLVSLAGPANKQARIAADNICGIDSRYNGALGSSIIQLFDITVASTGLNEAAAEKAGIDFDSVILAPLSHASYYPDAKVMTMKVVFERKTGRLLGAQIAGTDGVDKRIDVLAAAICNGMNATELRELELSYAPPYSSAKDPVNMAGYVIENVVCGLVKQFHYNDIDSLVKRSDVFLLDTRTQGEYSRGHIDGFVNIPVDELRERINEVPENLPVYVICQSGLRSYIACRILSGHGYDCYNFAGGYRFYDAVRSDKAACDNAYPCGLEKNN